MKSTPLILAAGVVFGAIYGTNALLPDMYDNPTSEVQAGQARILTATRQVFAWFEGRFQETAESRLENEGDIAADYLEELLLDAIPSSAAAGRPRRW